MINEMNVFSMFISIERIPGQEEVNSNPIVVHVRAHNHNKGKL